MTTKKKPTAARKKEQAEVSDSGDKERPERPPKALAKRLALLEPKIEALCSARRTNRRPCDAYAFERSNVPVLTVGIGLSSASCGAADLGDE